MAGPLGDVPCIDDGGAEIGAAVKLAWSSVCDWNLDRPVWDGAGEAA